MLYRRILRTLFVYFAVPLLFAGGPIAWFSGPKWWSGLTTSLAAHPGTPSQRSQRASTASGDPVVEASATPALASVPPIAGPAGGEPIAMDGPPIHELPEVLRFDISPRWIADNWPRVSTALGEMQLQGYRVPLVTGAAEDDLAGSLTYYFNPWQQLQRITFVGTSGDVRKVVALVTSQFGFARRLTNDPGQFIYEVHDPYGKLKGVLWIRNAPVIKSSQPRERFDVSLSIDRPEK